MARTQCSKCPWKMGTNPHEIPDGYCEAKHENLRETIAEPGAVNLKPGTVMACHHSLIGEEFVCLGWLHNQLGPGNNIALRMAVLGGQFADDVKGELDGSQHDSFEDTLPESK